MAAKLDADDVVSILNYFDELEDPRSSINRKHLLGDLIVICVMAVIAGADGPRAIGVWAESNLQWLKKYLALPGGAPSHDTIGRLLATLKPDIFQRCFQEWIDSLREDAAAEEDRPEIIAIDGKTVRRSHDAKKGLGALHLVSAWAVRSGISLGQLATEEKSNEITAIPELLENIDVHRAIVTIDAAGCQKEIAAKIVEGGGDYVLALKGNQPTLYQSVRDYIMEHMENNFADVTARTLEEKLKGHGRTETIVYYQLSLPEYLPGKAKWKGLRTIGVAIRMSEEKGKHTSDVRYYISSLRLGVKQFAEAVRKHWSIENTLHWCLDVTFREDENRVRNRLAADNLAWLKRFAITLLKQQPSKESIAMRRRMAGWNVDYLAQVVGLKRI